VALGINGGVEHLAAETAGAGAVSVGGVVGSKPYQPPSTHTAQPTRRVHVYSNGKGCLAACLCERLDLRRVIWMGLWHFEGKTEGAACVAALICTGAGQPASRGAMVGGGGPMAAGRGARNTERGIAGHGMLAWRQRHLEIAHVVVAEGEPELHVGWQVQLRDICGGRREKLLRA
jgi:hypothetical protein